MGRAPWYAACAARRAPSFAPTSSGPISGGTSKRSGHDPAYTIWSGVIGPPSTTPRPAGLAVKVAARGDASNVTIRNGPSPASRPRRAGAMASMSARARSGFMPAGSASATAAPDAAASIAARTVVASHADRSSTWDGASPVCPWEEPPDALAERTIGLGIHVAELIPNRNAPAVVDAYVAAFRRAGILVMAGTEHNTRQRISLEPRCADGSVPSADARAAFWEATCVVAAHQHLRASGRPGFVDGRGELNPGFPDGPARVRWFSELGADLIDTASRAVAR